VPVRLFAIDGEVYQEIRGTEVDLRLDPLFSVLLILFGFFDNFPILVASFADVNSAIRLEFNNCS
jgi:hypothetical protein